MGIRKYGDQGDGKVLPDPEDTTKTAAAKPWTDEDSRDLERELGEDDS